MTRRMIGESHNQLTMETYFTNQNEKGTRVQHNTGRISINIVFRNSLIVPCSYTLTLLQ